MCALPFRPFLMSDSRELLFVIQCSVFVPEEMICLVALSFDLTISATWGVTTGIINKIHNFHISFISKLKDCLISPVINILG